MPFNDVALACQVVGVPAAAGGTDAGVDDVSVWPPPAAVVLLLSFFSFAQPPVVSATAMMKSATQ